MQFPEQDWKTLSRLKPLALDRLCRRILDEAQAIIASAAEGEHHRAYLALYRHIQERDRLLADGFDRWSRSQAVVHLLVWRQRGLSAEEPVSKAGLDATVAGRPTLDFVEGHASV